MGNQQPQYYINKQQKSANNLNQTYSSSINTNSQLSDQVNQTTLSTRVQALKLQQQYNNSNP